MITSIFIFLSALAYSLVEIEVEGKYGWAKKAPTFYVKGWLGKLFENTFSGKLLTGYHLYLGAFIVIIFHAPFAFGQSWNLVSEIVTLSSIILWFLLEDFLWFVFNPSFGISNFDQTKINWHSGAKWYLDKIPNDYINFACLYWVISIIAYIYSEDVSVIYRLSLMFILALILSFFSIYFAPYYHRWRKRQKKLG